MAETTQINKFRQKRLRDSNSKTNIKDDTTEAYFYPKQNLYTRQEFELLDTIYSDSDEQSDVAIAERVQKESLLSDFWPQNKEEYLSASQNKNNLFKNLIWFLIGVMSTSAVWLIYFQLSIHQIKTKADTQIVFQESAKIMTDKTADKTVTQKLENQALTEEKGQRLESIDTPHIVNISQPAQTQNKEVPRGSWVSWFNAPLKKVEAPKQVTPSIPSIQQPQTVRYHTIGNGDSLWIIANKYYANPSPENIAKIMKANNMKRIGVLSIGQKLVIP